MEDFTLHGRKDGGNKMKYFLFLIIIYPQIVSAEWVCPAPAGCKIVPDTGECIGCIEVKEPPIIKEEKVVEKKPVVKVSKPPLYPRVNESLGKTNKKKGVCYVEPCDWLNKKKPVVKTKPTKPKSWKGTLFKCVVGCRYAWWDSEGNDYDEDGNLISNSLVYQSKPKRNCSQKWECIVPPCNFIDADGCLIGD